MNITTILLFLLPFIMATDINDSSRSFDIEAKSKAADEDIMFVLIFFQDFEEQLPNYTSYMIKNHIKFPQDVADYYYHLVGLPSTADIQSDVVSYFPFTQFHTFATAFPWYSSMLTKAGMSRFYLPEDFITPTETEVPTSVSSSSVVPATKAKNHAPTLLIPLGMMVLANLLLL